MGDRQSKDALVDGFAEMAEALAGGRRAESVDALAQGEHSVDDVAEALGRSVANTSHHLRTLARAGRTDVAVLVGGPGDVAAARDHRLVQ